MFGPTVDRARHREEGGRTYRHEEVDGFIARRKAFPRQKPLHTCQTEGESLAISHMHVKGAWEIPGAA